MNRTAREEYKALPLGDYHLCFDRLEGGLLFYTEEDYRLGMAGIALAFLKFGVKIYVIELMPNHLHVVMRGTGEQCMKVFSLQKRRISEQLIKCGRPPLSNHYGCVLKALPDKEALRAEIIYAVRNPYEKDYCVPGGHQWGSGYLYFNDMAMIVRGDKVSSLQKAQVHAFIGSNELLPPDWEIHPALGVLPRNYVDVQAVERMFGTAKEYHTRLVKEYETAVKIARSLGEEVEFSAYEVRDIVNTELRNAYPGRLFKALTQEEKCRVAVTLNDRLGLTPAQLAPALYISELTISQVLRSKDYGVRR